MRFVLGLLIGLVVGALAGATISFSDGDDRQIDDARASSVEDVVLPEEESGDLDARPVSRAQTGRLVIPVDGVSAAELTDTFSDSRGDGERSHDAIDIPASRGTPVVAAAPGVVEKLFTSDAGGLTVYIRSEDRRWIYYYAHLQRYTRDLAEGDRVRAGTMIGRVGSTGNARADAPHLHFAVMRMGNDEGWWEGEAVNPYPLLTASSG